MSLSNVRTVFKIGNIDLFAEEFPFNNYIVPLYNVNVLFLLSNEF